MPRPQQLQEEADAIRDEAKSLERRVRLLKQMSAQHSDNLSAYLSQSKEDTDGNQQVSVEEG